MTAFEYIMNNKNFKPCRYCLEYQKLGVCVNAFCEYRIENEINIDMVVNE